MELPKPTKDDREWSDALLRAAAPQETTLHGDARERWDERLLKVGWLHLRRRTQPLLVPGAKDRRELGEAAARLLAVLTRFLPPPPLLELGNFLPDGWWTLRDPSAESWQRPGEEVGEHLEAVIGLLVIAKRAEEEDRRGGRPRVDPDDLFTARLLVPLYKKAFSRPASAKPDGPTFRFAQAFFESFKGEWCSTRRAPGQTEPTRFDVTAPRGPTLLTLLKTAIARAATAEAGRSGAAPTDWGAETALRKATARSAAAAIDAAAAAPIAEARAAVDRERMASEQGGAADSATALHAAWKAAAQERTMARVEAAVQEAATRQKAAAERFARSDEPTARVAAARNATVNAARTGTYSAVVSLWPERFFRPSSPGPGPGPTPVRGRAPRAAG